MSDYDRWAKYYDLIYGKRMDYDAQCAYVRSLFEELEVPRSGRVLDLGCGTGGHAIPLARMGYAVTGIDNSEPMLDIAKKKAGDLPVEFVHQDMKDLNLSREFDAAICMFGGFGHITDILDVRSALRGISRILHQDAPFIFEYWSVGGVRPGHAASEDVERDDLRISRSSASVFDPATKIIDIGFDFTVRREENIVEVFRIRTSIRCYEVGEMDALLEDAGFEVVGTKDSDGLHRTDTVATILAPVRRNTFRILCVARNRR